MTELYIWVKHVAEAGRWENTSLTRVTLMGFII